MEKTISNLCEFFIRQQIIQAADKEVYQYCFEVLAMKLIYYAGCIAIMWHYQCFLLPIIFIATHTVLRSYMGGWHAANMWVCLFSSLLLFTCWSSSTRETFMQCFQHDNSGSGHAPFWYAGSSQPETDGR